MLPRRNDGSITRPSDHKPATAPDPSVLTARRRNHPDGSRRAAAAAAVAAAAEVSSASSDEGDEGSDFDLSDIEDDAMALALSGMSVAPASSSLSGGIPLTEKNLRAHTESVEQHHVRLFGCGQCDHVFMKRVPVRKPVARCTSNKRCGLSLEAIPQDKEPIGKGHFRCVTCKRDDGKGAYMWTSFPSHHTVSQKCYMCFTDYFPTFVVPCSQMHQVHNKPKTSKVHSCSACRNLPPNSQCPIKTLPRVIPASEVHDPTGSTCTSIMSTYQDDINNLLNDASFFEDVAGQTIDSDVIRRLVEEAEEWKPVKRRR